MHRNLREAPAAAVSTWGLAVRQHQLERMLGLVLWVAFVVVLVRIAA
jgi:hypothetical protein